MAKSKVLKELANNEITLDVALKRLLLICNDLNYTELFSWAEKELNGYSSDEAVFTAGNALVADIFRTAGGENVMNHTTDPWMNVSWEEVAASNPEWIVIGVYEGAEDADYWMDFLEKHPAMSETTAVQEENYVIVGLADLTVGERVADTVGTLASYFHPDK